MDTTKTTEVTVKIPNRATVKNNKVATAVAAAINNKVVTANSNKGMDSNHSNTVKAIRAKDAREKEASATGTIIIMSSSKVPTIINNRVSSTANRARTAASSRSTVSSNATASNNSTVNNRVSSMAANSNTRVKVGLVVLKTVTVVC